MNLNDAPQEQQREELIVDLLAGDEYADGAATDISQPPATQLAVSEATPLADPMNNNDVKSRRRRCGDGSIGPEAA